MDLSEFPDELPTGLQKRNGLISILQKSLPSWVQGLFSCTVRAKSSFLCKSAHSRSSWTKVSFITSPHTFSLRTNVPLYLASTSLSQDSFMPTRPAGPLYSARLCGSSLLSRLGLLGCCHEYHARPLRTATAFKWCLNVFGQRLRKRHFLKQLAPMSNFLQTSLGSRSERFVTVVSWARCLHKRIHPGVTKGHKHVSDKKIAHLLRVCHWICCYGKIKEAGRSGFVLKRRLKQFIFSVIVD